MENRHYSTIDRVLGHFDQAWHTVFGPRPISSRDNPSSAIPEAELSDTDRTVSGRLMRVNHTGEVCAQALYQGQAATARLAEVREKMDQAAKEENDHLSWTMVRLHELDSHPSYLNPLWYAGSFAIGALAGLAGDRWSLGFVAETEKQVVEHLEGHLQKLPSQDFRSRHILSQMRDDEGRHATVAMESGAATLPEPVRQLMRFASRIMTCTAYWI